MRASRFMALVGFGVAGASLSLMGSCSGGSSGGEIEAAVHDLKCNEYYCRCAGLNGEPPWDGVTEEDCRKNYCEGGPFYGGGDVMCLYGMPGGSACDEQGYCDCLAKGQPEWECQNWYCGGKPPDFTCEHPIPPCDEEGYCDCTSAGAPESYCRDKFCLDGSPSVTCAPIGCDEQAYCDCTRAGASPAYCRDEHCPNPTRYLSCPDYPPCDPEYCTCVGGGTPEPTCRAKHCTGEPLIMCPGPVCAKQQKDTGWKDGSRFFSTSSWHDPHLATRLDNQSARYILRYQCNNQEEAGRYYVGPMTRTSNHLDLRKFEIAVPEGAKLTGIEARVKQRGGTLVQTVLFTPSGPTPNLGNGRVVNGFHYFGGPNNLFGKTLTAEQTRTPGLWGLSMRAQVTAARARCPTVLLATSEVDVIQFRAHYEVEVCE